MYNKSAKIPVSFHIVGNSLSSKDDEFLRLQAIAEKNGVSDHIVFHGAMHGEQLDMLYNKMDIAVDFSVVIAVAMTITVLSNLKNIVQEEYPSLKVTMMILLMELIIIFNVNQPTVP